MAWLRSPNIKDGEVSVNAKIFEFKHGLVQVEQGEDIRIFCEYLHCEIVPDEVAQSLIEAEGTAKETATEEEAKTRKKKG